MRAAILVIAQHSSPPFKISPCLHPVWQERLEAEWSICPKIWGSAEVKKWKQQGRGEVLSEIYLKGLCFHQSGLTKQEVSPLKPHGLFRCLQDAGPETISWVKGNDLGERGGVRKHTEPWQHLSSGNKNMLLWN